MGNVFGGRERNYFLDIEFFFEVVRWRKWKKGMKIIDFIYRILYKEVGDFFFNFILILYYVLNKLYFLNVYKV